MPELFEHSPEVKCTIPQGILKVQIEQSMQRMFDVINGKITLEESDRQAEALKSKKRLSGLWRNVKRRKVKPDKNQGKLEL